jgi:glutathionylspermidine synthase
MALDFDAETPTMPTETRQQAERWLVSMARADLVAQILEGA